jgi:hypothetical protein
MLRLFGDVILNDEWAKLYLYKKSLNAAFISMQDGYCFPKISTRKTLCWQLCRQQTVKTILQTKIPFS